MSILREKLIKILNSEERINLMNMKISLNNYKYEYKKDRNIIFALRGGNNKYKEYDKNYDNKTGKYNIIIDDNKYYYRVERYSGDEDFRIIDIISIKDEYKNNIDCGSIQIDKKQRIATIISLGNSNKCIKSDNKKVKFKYGDIIFQIMMNICKKENLRKIELSDNSNINCSGYSLILNYIKTMTHGIPHYYKYGFKFKLENDNKILNNNYKNYMKDPKINKNDLLEIIKNKGSVNIINHLYKVINKLSKEEISIKKFILLLTQDLENREYCELTNNIYITLYEYGGYKPYYSKSYELLL